jgi:hypothetical protein
MSGCDSAVNTSIPDLINPVGATSYPATVPSSGNSPIWLAWLQRVGSASLVFCVGASNY